MFIKKIRKKKHTESDLSKINLNSNEELYKNLKRKEIKDLIWELEAQSNSNNYRITKEKFRKINYILANNYISAVNEVEKYHPNGVTTYRIKTPYEIINNNEKEITLSLNFLTVTKDGMDYIKCIQTFFWKNLFSIIASLLAFISIIVSIFAII